MRTPSPTGSGSGSGEHPTPPVRVGSGPGAAARVGRTRLTHLDQDGKSLLESWCYVIREVIERLAEDAWYPRLHLPIKYSAPWKDDGLISAEVYNLNSGLLWCNVNALIVLTYRGGGLGAGKPAIRRIRLTSMQDGRLEHTPYHVRILLQQDASYPRKRFTLAHEPYAPQTYPLVRVVVPAAAGSSPVAHTLRRR